MKLLICKKAQSTAEYAILVALVIAAAIAMQTYVKRSMQGGTKFVVDKLKDKTGQYEPYYLKSAYKTKVGKYEETEETKLKGKVIRELGKGAGGVQTTTRTGQQVITGVPTD